MVWLRIKLHEIYETEKENSLGTKRYQLTLLLERIPKLFFPYQHIFTFFFNNLI